MANVLLVFVVLMSCSFVFSLVRRHRHGLVAERGTSIGADLGALADQPRVSVQVVSKTGPDRVRLVLSPLAGGPAGDVTMNGSHVDIVVQLREGDFGFDQLQEWQRSASPLAIVMPPETNIVRLRSIEDLQPLTLRRVSED